MDKNKFKQLLEQVAEVETLTPKFTKSQAGLDEDELAVVNFDGEWVRLDMDYNPTLGFKMIKLKDKLRPCDLSCGDVVPNQIIEKRHYKHPYSHWRTYCKTCAKYVSPDGKSFISGGFAINYAFENYHKKQDKD
jgi:hypothetical protein